MKNADFCVSWTSALACSHGAVHYSTKAAAAKAARQLFTEGARNIRTWRVSESVGAIEFDWRKVARFA